MSPCDLLLIGVLACAFVRRFFCLLFRRRVPLLHANKANTGVKGGGRMAEGGGVTNL